mmetsp:Transcript_7220/g.10585  ORF Transcript_7220/g.10585 Transcript_7220/m.10585 type:complete len:109 (-) Transcript_7220:313-639(-)
MGGPCWLLRNKEGNKSSSRWHAPRCTDNFQIMPFVYPMGDDGREWQSVEQCYQGQKFQDELVREEIRLTLPTKKRKEKRKLILNMGFGCGVWATSDGAHVVRIGTRSR